VGTDKDTKQAGEEDTKRSLPSFRLIGGGILLIIGLIIVLQNTESVETRLLFATVVMPRAVLLFITFLLGVGVGLIVAFVRQRRARR
jgi:uncharacterized integral membrane protein